MGGEYADMELASFMSTSKGFMGEWVELYFVIILKLKQLLFASDICICMYGVG